MYVHASQADLLAALSQDSSAAAQRLRAQLAGGAGSRRRPKMLRLEMQVDISMGIADSEAAVNYLQRQVGADGTER